MLSPSLSPSPLIEESSFDLCEKYSTNQCYLLSFETETAWDTCKELFLEIAIYVGMNSLSHTESVNVDFRSDLYMMKMTS